MPMGCSRDSRSFAVVLVLSWSLAVFSARASQSNDPPPAEVVIHVVDDATGQPVADAAVKVWHNERGATTEQLSWTTDAAGRAVVESPAGKLLGMYISASAPRHVPVRLDLTFGAKTSAERGEQAHYTLRLPQGTRVGGRVVDERGEPIAGARLRVSAEPVEGHGFEPGVPRPICYEEFVTTDADGRWYCDRLPKEWSNVFVMLAHPDFVDDDSLRRLEDEQALRDEAVELTMWRGRALNGRVTDSDGRPVAGAKLALRSTAAEHGGTFTTDAEGWFDAGQVAKEGFFYVIRAEDRAPLLGWIAPGDPTENLALTMPETRQVRLQLQNSAGEPVAGWVRVSGWDKMSMPDHQSAWTDDAGRLTLHVPNVPVDLDVSSDQGVHESVTVPTDFAEFVVTTRSIIRIEVEAFDADTGHPVSPDRVVINAPSSGWSAWSPATVTDDGATSEITWPIDGQVSARVEKAGYAVTMTPVVEAEPGKPVRLQAKLESAEPLAGTLLNPDGTPAAGASVLLLSRWESLYIDEEPRDDLRGVMSVPITRAGEDGAFALAREAGVKTLFARSESGYAFIDDGALGEEPIRLRPWRPVTLRLSHRGAPVVGATAGWTGLDEGRLNLMGLQHETNSYGSTTFARTAGEASRFNYRIDGESRTRLWRRLEGDEPVEIYLELSAALSGRAIAPPDLPEGWAFEYATLVQPRDDSASLSTAPRTVLDDPSEEWPVQVIAMVSEDGTFDFGPIVPGRYLLTLTTGLRGTGWACALGLPLAREQRWIEVPAGETIGLGDVLLERIPRPEVGDVAPPLSAKTLDGHPFELTDLAGKIIVLDFWATWCAPCIADLPHLRALRDELAGDERVIIVSLSLDQVVEDAAKYVPENDMSGANWRHAHIGLASEVAQQYGVPSIPNVWVVAPDGRILARDLKAADAAEVVRESLNGSPR